MRATNFPEKPDGKPGEYRNQSLLFATDTNYKYLNDQKENSLFAADANDGCNAAHDRSVGPLTSASTGQTPAHLQSQVEKPSVPRITTVIPSSNPPQTTSGKAQYRTPQRSHHAIQHMALKLPDQSLGNRFRAKRKNPCGASCTAPVMLGCRFCQIFCRRSHVRGEGFETLRNGSAGFTVI